MVKVKGNIIKDSFEQALEAFNPLRPSNKSNESNKTNLTNKSNESHKINESNKSNESNTPLDFKKLQEKYKDKDKIKVEGLRNVFFQRVRAEDEQSLHKEKMEDSNETSEENKLVQDQETKKQEKKQQQGDIPQGKVRRSIFSRKKTAQRLQTELKPAVGKQ